MEVMEQSSIAPEIIIIIIIIIIYDSNVWHKVMTSGSYVISDVAVDLLWMKSNGELYIHSLCYVAFSR